VDTATAMTAAAAIAGTMTTTATATTATWLSRSDLCAATRSDVDDAGEKVEKEKE